MKIKLLKLKIIKSIENLFNPNQPKWVYLCIFSLFLVGIASHLIAGSANGQNEIIPEEKFETADTYIPNGYVLVPLEVSNANVLSTLMGQFTFVDIYSLSDLSDKPRKLIAQNLRLVKAPHDENLFAVLVGENQIDLIHKLSNPVFVVIKNPKNKRVESIPKTEQIDNISKKTRITYGN